MAAIMRVLPGNAILLEVEPATFSAINNKQIFLHQKSWYQIECNQQINEKQEVGIIMNWVVTWFILRMALIEDFESKGFVEKISSMNSSSEIKLPLDKQKPTIRN